LIATLSITILAEGIVVFLYSTVQKKPAGRLLVASVIVNVLTQSLLWIVLQVYFSYYLIALFMMEIVIWLVESLLVFRLSGGHLNLKSAMTLSFLMNVTSFGIGWLMPV
jgi:hypothetical protein